MRLMLDSGAFSVWNSGHTIDIDEYIRFCLKYPGVSHYVNLDVIPGKPGDLTSPRTREQINAAAEASLANYKKMCSHLPEEKVIAVFHRGEEMEWLEKYLDIQAPYIGIGQAVAFGSKDSQRNWLHNVKQRVVDSAGELIVKTHGFAVTSFKLMAYMPWHSVDSASWVKQAAYGTIWLPRRVPRGENPFGHPPDLLTVSPKSPSRLQEGKHIDSLPPQNRQKYIDYLKTMKMELGEYEVVDVDAGYKLKDDELWWSKGLKEDEDDIHAQFNGFKHEWFEKREAKWQVMRVVKKGVATDHQRRFWVNVKFMLEANKVLPVNRIYFAGGEGSVLPNIERRLQNRLMSYHKVGVVPKGETKGLAAFREWEKMANGEHD